MVTKRIGFDFGFVILAVAFPIFLVMVKVAMKDRQLPLEKAEVVAV
jgi:hypothetical protein